MFDGYFEEYWRLPCSAFGPLFNIESKISFFFCVHSCNTIIVGEIGKLDLVVPVKFSSILPAGNLMAENSFLLSPISGI